MARALALGRGALLGGAGLPPFRRHLALPSRLPAFGRGVLLAAGQSRLLPRLAALDRGLALPRRLSTLGRGVVLTARHSGPLPVLAALDGGPTFSRRLSALGHGLALFGAAILPALPLGGLPSLDLRLRLGTLRRRTAAGR